MREKDEPGRGLSLEGIEQMPLARFIEDAYLNYSMSVIRDRALPAVTDGMKPVQRRIVYAMARLGINPKSKHTKSARTVGEVLGKYHPHGDAACYEAMVLMAQPFSYRYPLIDGQGNWGDSEEPKSFAAMRYTEARLAPYSNVLLEDLNSGCVDWLPNFDGTVDEPRALPARLPNILLNGTFGIAVGMATDIPPHNLNEVARAAAALLDKPEIGVPELMEYVRGPDYPGGAQITTPREELIKIYSTGRGSVRQRAVYEVGKEGIVITALPHQVSGGKIEKQIADLMLRKKLPQVSDLINASDHEHPTRLIIVPRSRRVNAAELMEQLFALTDLECRYNVNLNMLGLDGRPAVKDLKTILREWLSFRTDCVRKRLRARLTAVDARLHLLEGLMIAFLNLDEVIGIIRREDEPRAVLIARFSLSAEQADYILETRLKQLARLEELKIRDEQAKLAEEKARLEGILGSEARLKGFIKREIKADARLYGDERRCRLVEHAAAEAVKEADLLPVSAMTVVLSRMGWVRAASGSEVDAPALPYRTGDGFKDKAEGRSNETAAFISSLGRVYCVDIRDLPSARGQGEPLSARLRLSEGELAEYVLVPRERESYLLASDKGYGFVCGAEDLLTRSRSGRQLMNLDEGARLFRPLPVPREPDALLAAASRTGKLLIYRLSELSRHSSGRGTKLMAINGAKLEVGADGIAALCVLPAGAGLKIICGRRFISLSAAEVVGRISSRTRPGDLLPRGFQKVDALEAVPGASPGEFAPEPPGLT